MTVGTHQGHSRTYASASLLYTTIIFFLPPGFLTSRSHTIVNICSQYKRENCTRCGRQLGPSSSSSICVFVAWALQSFSWWWFRCCSEESRVLTGRAVARLAQDRYPAQILIFLRWKWLVQLYVFLRNTQARSTCYSPPAGLQIFPRRDALGLTRKWALKNNKWDVIIKSGQ